MKKLSRIKLQEVTALNDKEMKMVLGGTGGSGFFCHCYEREGGGSGIIAWSADYANDLCMMEDIRIKCHSKGGYCEPNE